MGSEKSLWRTIRTNMKDHWEVERIENFIGPGTPDLYYTMSPDIMGWIELKYLNEWPKRESTPVKIEHYTLQQRNWIKRHGSKGAQIFLLLQVNREYLLFDWKAAIEYVGYYPKSELILVALKYWKNQINYDEFIKEIS